jgi:hypothetical protein
MAKISLLSLERRIQSCVESHTGVLLFLRYHEDLIEAMEKTKVMSRCGEL